MHSDRHEGVGVRLQENIAGSLFACKLHSNCLAEEVGLSERHSMPQVCRSRQSWSCSIALQLTAAVCCASKCTMSGLITAPNRQTGALQASESRFQKDMRSMESRLEGAQAEVSTSRQVRAGRNHAHRTDLSPLHARGSGSPATCW